MEKAIKARFSRDILEEALSRYGIERDTVEELKGFESFVFKCTHEDRDRILRISHSRHRRAEHISSEIDWIAFLADNGVSACRAVPSLEGRVCEMIGEDDDHFTATVFETAPGVPAGDETWQPDLFESMGKIMARMHVLAGKYVPRDSLLRRPDWYEEAAGLAVKYLPENEGIAIKKYRENLEATQALSKSDDNFGLVHLDFHRGNFFVDEGKIHLFDFDDCQYSWFADDIAMALFYALPHDTSSAADLTFARKFLRHFLKGYRSEKEIKTDQLRNIPLFLKRREIDIYALIHRSMDLDNLGPWSKSFMNRRSEKIANDVPYVDLDFAIESFS